MHSTVATVGSNSWRDLTADEIRDVGSQDGSVLVVPIGSMEQHGDHLPVSTDSVLVSEIAALGVARVEEDVPILMLPTLWCGYSPHHLSFGGTVSLEFDHMHRILEDIAGTALENGFDALLLLNGHGGNTSLVNGAVSTIGSEYDDVEVLGLTYFRLASRFIDEIRDSEIGGMGHGGEFETSLMLHLREDLVRENELTGTAMDEPYEEGIKDMFEGGPLAVYRGFEEYSTTGAIGSPEHASAEKGEQLYDRLGDELESLLRDVYERNRS
ncbi:creatininase family protein [Halorarum salinum]|uniref:Creatininase family protein n=1 Tax=Halorarum salinum TaxID=2743089 RepID=A0A7D5L9F3_9EURY|nr:creatininase family protein [Halobaculum salinum]QLG61051.1 creatininase family protein [Halobaculum salinum]